MLYFNRNAAEYSSVQTEEELHDSTLYLNAKNDLKAACDLSLLCVYICDDGLTYC